MEVGFGSTKLTTLLPRLLNMLPSSAMKTQGKSLYQHRKQSEQFKQRRRIEPIKHEIGAEAPYVHASCV
jgi:hypothetical protein